MIPVSEAKSLFQNDTPIVSGLIPTNRTHNVHLLYRARFILSGINIGEQAILRFYANALTEIAINEKAIHQGPCRSSVPLLYFDEIPIDSLKDGENILTFHQCIETISEEVGILCELEITRSGNIEYYLQSPNDFEVCILDSYASDAPKNYGTGYAEYFTLSKYEWYSKDYPGDFIATQASKTIYKKINWHKRSIPLFHENAKYPININEKLDNSLLLDFGTMVFGRLEIDGTGSGLVKIEYIEDLDGGWISPEGTCVMYDDRVIGACGKFHWKCFHKRSFRYVCLKNVEKSGLRLRVQKYNYPTKDIGTFNSSDPFLNRLAKISTDTLKVCLDDIYNDCPHRDQAQWMDAFAASQATLGLFGITDLTRKCILQYGKCSIRNQRLVSPSITGNSSLPDYSFIFFSFVIWYYHISGDKELLSDLYDNLKEILSGFKEFIMDDGLLENPVKLPDFIYLDNTFELAKEGKSSALNALYYKALNDFVTILKILNKDSEALEYSKIADQVRTSYIKIFQHKKYPHCFCDTDIRSDKSFYLVNFSCELGHWNGSCGVLELTVNASRDCRKIIEYADYAGIRLYVNGQKVLEKERNPSWSRQPMYDPETVEVVFKKGKNNLRFEVLSNELNWELFFRSGDNELLRISEAYISETDWNNGKELHTPHKIRLRNWVPPILSQSTHAYAAFADLHNNIEFNKKMLHQVIGTEYLRTYLSVRIPSFCRESGSDHELDNWIMPTNTPWTSFFLLSALFKNDCADEGLNIIRTYWHDMISSGAVNTWEEWGSRSSLCHAWGAVPIYFMQREILGVHHDTKYKGWIWVRPNLFDLDFAEGSVALNEEYCNIINIKLERKGDETVVSIKTSSKIPIRLDLSKLDNAILTECSVFSTI